MFPIFIPLLSPVTLRITRIKCRLMAHSAYHILKLIFKNTTILICIKCCSVNLCFNLQLNLTNISDYFISVVIRKTPINGGAGEEGSKWCRMPISFYYCTPRNGNLKSFNGSETSACIVVCSVAKIAREIFLCYHSKH